MKQRILIIGAGFAGMWSALAAARVLDNENKADGLIEIALIAPEPVLHLRPRFYESGPAGMKAPLGEMFDEAGVRFVHGRVTRIRTADNEVDVLDHDGHTSTMHYDRLVLAAGSRLFTPDIPGLREHSFNVDQLTEAVRLEAHLNNLASLPDTPGRNTVVIGGGGFTGIETAAEMPARLRAALGHRADINVTIIEQAAHIGPDLGSGPRPVITQALQDLGVSWRVETAVTAIDADGVQISNGERIDSKTVIWTAGARASALTEQIPAKRDRLGRLHVDRSLRVIGLDNVFATGDVAYAATDDDGNHALMSCQHAMNLGRYAGNNVASDLLGLGAIPYTQTRYVTCLDLGPWGAVYTEGWDRAVKLTGAEAKQRKRWINTERIYPPRANRAEALAAADPLQTIVQPRS
ncbi:NAD(P)/FAD-dependent oxidoreductase [Bradyrhizobium sp. SYSU BS000235]|uniref:NAD(P)/FAD-dependent oxidoreductase n=1 Tax=Bradyrhizobium sp. SYSU BS000235 TaxID=3411332 RepID=UPI003C731BFE